MSTTAEQDVIVAELLPSQETFVHARPTEVLLSGAFGSGKSRGLCYKLLTHAVIPGNRVGLCRKELAALKATTLHTLLRPEGDLPPVLPEGTYRHNKQDREIHLNGGGEIYYFGFDKEIRVASLNVGCVAVDEAIELDEDEYTMLLGRARYSVDPNNQVFGATNPGSPSHFLYKRFYGAPDPERLVIESNTLENPFLPAKYLKTLSSLSGIAYQRYVLGKWVAMEGLIYAYLRATHCVERSGPWVETVLGVDEGYTNPAVIMVVRYDMDGRAHVSEEFYETEVKPSTFVEKVVQVARQTDADAVYVPPEAAGLIADLAAHGLPVQPADNAVDSGIREVQDRLLVLGDNRPRLTIEPVCANAANEFVSYRWAKGSKTKPIKEADHAMDALRYALYTHGKAGAGRRNARRGRIIA